MNKLLNSYRSIPVSGEGSAEKIVIPVSVGLIVGALAVTGANVIQTHVVDTMNDNMGKAIHRQITGEDTSVKFASALDDGSVKLPVQYYDVDSKKQDK
jgi:hypothetical protein